jgi:hypothetical protein
MLITLILLVATAAAAAAAAPDAAELPTYRCTATTQTITIDGKLDDPAWQTAAWTSDFVNLRGPNAPARPDPPRTRAKVAWDERNLYLAAEVSEADVRATMKEHDAALYRENAFEVFIDPDNDGENYVELEINALNTTFDLLMSKPYQLRGKADDKWEVAGLRTAVHVEGTINDSGDADKAWTLEMAIPWTAMKELTADTLPPKPGARFRLNMARVMSPPPSPAEGGGKNRYATWSPINEASLHVPARWGWVEFAAAPAAPPAGADTRGRAATRPAPRSP